MAFNCFLIRPGTVKSAKGGNRGSDRLTVVQSTDPSSSRIDPKPSLSAMDLTA